MEEAGDDLGDSPSEIAYAETAKCRLPCELEAIAPAVGKLKDFCLARGLDAARWPEIELAVVEGLNNAIEHGCGEGAGGTVLLRWEWPGEIIRIEVIDPGDFIPAPGEAALPDDPLAEGGRGAFLMAQLMDSVEHLRSADGHLLRMTKNVGAPVFGAARFVETEATLEAMTEDLSRSYEELSALFRFAENLATTPNFAAFLEDSLQRLLTLVQGEFAYVRFLGATGDALEIVRSDIEALWDLPPAIPMDLPWTEPDVIRSKTAVTIDNSGSLSRDDPLHRFGGGAYVCPIFFQSSVLGCLTAVRKNDLPYFSAGELSLIRFVADFLGIARTTSQLQVRQQAEQRALREIEIAASIQQALLPARFPDSDFYRVQGVCHSARQAGGDYFDAIQLGSDGMLFVIADVMGKGVPAALLATILRTAIRARLRLAATPGRLLTEVNHQIAPDLAELDMFITAQVGYLSEKDHTLTISTAGHCPLLQCRSASGRVEQLFGEGIPLGVLEYYEYTAQTHSVTAGDLFVFLTDGLYEVEDAGGMLGMGRLIERLEELRRQNAVDYCTPMIDYVREFSGNRSASDDRTLLTVERIK